MSDKPDHLRIALNYLAPRTGEQKGKSPPGEGRFLRAGVHALVDIDETLRGILEELRRLNDRLERR